jgi:hypothetical protein
MYTNFERNNVYNYTAQQLVPRNVTHCGLVCEACHATNTAHVITERTGILH